METLSTANVCEVIFAIRKNRVLTASIGDRVFRMEIPKTISRFQLSDYKKSLLHFLMEVGKGMGGIVVNLTDGDKEEVFGIKAKPNVWEWEPLSRRYMTLCYTTCSDCGGKMGLPENLTITTIDKYFPKEPTTTKVPA